MSDTDPVPGGGTVESIDVELVSSDDPAAAAATIAHERFAELVADEDAVIAAVLARMDVEPIEPEGIESLRQLAGELGRASRIHSRTAEGFRDTMADRLARTSGIAVHPEAIRAAAAAVVDAERDLAVAAEQLGAHGAPTGNGGPGAGAGAPPRPTPNDGASDAVHRVVMFDEDPRDVRRMQQAGYAIAGLAAVLGIVLLATGTSWRVAAVIAVASMVLSLVVAVGGAAWVRSRLRREEAEERGTTNLAEFFPAEQPEAALDHAALRALEIERTRADERLRVARHHWESLVGHEADPHDVEGVLRTRDAQFDLVAAGELSPTVRAATALHRRSSARWRVAWATLGYDHPPPDHLVEAELDRLAAGTPRAIVLQEPAAWIAPDSLASLLKELPAATPVTIVRRTPRD